MVQPVRRGRRPGEAELALATGSSTNVGTFQPPPRSAPETNLPKSVTPVAFATTTGSCGGSA